VVQEVAAERLVPIKLAPFNAESRVGKLAADVTPNEDFYVRSNFKLPALDPASYRLRVGGNVERALQLGLDELPSLGTKTLVTTMECAGNNRMSLVPLPTGEPWQGGAVSTGRWSGVPLAAVLGRAGVKAGTVEILFEGADRGRPKDLPVGLAGPSVDIPFARALPLEKALHPDTLLALEMNGEPLPPDHGAPLRLVVPAWYGMASVKWVARIEALTEPFRGYYQVNRYVYDYGEGEPPPVTTMLVKSTIVSPGEGEVVPVGRALVRGRAWSGGGEIARVEVAVDGGETWQEARLGPALGSYGWRSWELEWEAADPGRHTLRCRATDAAGNVQPPLARWNKHGYGSNGVQVLVVNTR
jgi:DMSO/TMAO reductase YedYZ molybdopterin-dependent catalytic subunit